ncbi:hypothetical protein Bbelb_323570 [Branchiostoma belcheri]|nr:hypothetical protein Bbelb_323570 [Branchiostoma belcheri]
MTTTPFCKYGTTAEALSTAWSTSGVLSGDVTTPPPTTAVEESTDVTDTFSVGTEFTIVDSFKEGTTTIEALPTGTSEVLSSNVTTPPPTTAVEESTHTTEMFSVGTEFTHSFTEGTTTIEALSTGWSTSWVLSSDVTTPPPTTAVEESTDTTEMLYVGTEVTTVTTEGFSTGFSTDITDTDTTLHATDGGTATKMTPPSQVTTPSTSCATPCHLYATCVTRQSGHTCVCSSGYQGNGTICILAAEQVILEMTMIINYTADLADSSSQAFRTLARTVSSKIFVYLSSSTSGLLSVTVSSFRPGSVVATVNANFQQNTSVDAASVVNTLKQAVANDTENPLGLDTSSIVLIGSQLVLLLAYIDDDFISFIPNGNRCPVSGCGVSPTASVTNTTMSMDMTTSVEESTDGTEMFSVGTEVTIVDSFMVGTTTESLSGDVTTPPPTTAVQESTDTTEMFSVGTEFTVVDSFTEGTTTTEALPTGWSTSGVLSSDVTTPPPTTAVEESTDTTEMLYVGTEVTTVTTEGFSTGFSTDITDTDTTLHATDGGTATQMTTPSQVTTPSTSCATPCHLYATCVTRQSGHTCVCSSGYQGNGTICTLAAEQVILEITMNIIYTADLADSSSQAFRTLARTVSSKIFVYLSSSTSGLLSVTVSSFRPGSVVATVNANFQQNTSVDAASVVNTLKQAVANDTENPLGLDTSSIVLCPVSGCGVSPTASMTNMTMAMNMTTAVEESTDTTEMFSVGTEVTIVDSFMVGTTTDSFSGDVTTRPPTTAVEESTDTTEMFSVGTEFTIVDSFKEGTTTTEALSTDTPEILSSDVTSPPPTTTVEESTVSTEMLYVGTEVTTVTTEGLSTSFSTDATDTDTTLHATDGGTATQMTMNMTASSAMNMTTPQRHDDGQQNFVGTANQRYIRYDTASRNNAYTYTASKHNAHTYTASKHNAHTYTASKHNSHTNTASKHNAHTYTASKHNAHTYTASKHNSHTYTASKHNVHKCTASKHNAHTYTASKYNTQGYTTTKHNAHTYTASNHNAHSYTAIENNRTACYNRTYHRVSNYHWSLPGMHHDVPPLRLLCRSGFWEKLRLQCWLQRRWNDLHTWYVIPSKKVNLEMKMTSVPFTEDLKDKSSEAFRSLSFKVSQQIFVYLKTTSLGSSLLSVTILNFRQGSVVANYNANFQSNATVSDSGVSSALQQAISNDPNNTFGIDVSSLCTKSNEELACGETTGVDQNLVIGLGISLPLLAIILLIILGFLIKRSRDIKEEYNVRYMARRYGQRTEGKDVNLESGREQRTVPAVSYAMKPAAFERPRNLNYKRMMTFNR